MTPKIRLSKLLQSRLVLLVASVLLCTIMIHPVNPATTPGTLYVNPGNVALQPVSGSFVIQVKVASMDQFNGWDIQIFYNQAIINATALNITGNIFDANTTGGTPFEIVHCVNGKGTSCNTSTDGPGVVHSAYGNTAFTSGNGLLFTVTFRVLTADPSDTLAIRNDLISSSSPSGVPHLKINGTYGLFGGGLYGGGGSGRDFEL